MPLQSGKEAQVYLVRAGGEVCVAKVYKEIDYRGFRNRAEYLDGRQVKGSRAQRAVEKRSAFGRREEEEAWHCAEVQALSRMKAAGVRVPGPLQFMDGVLVMELVSDAGGRPAPRLADLSLGRAEAVEVFHLLLREVVKMLCAGLIHSDLSDFNVLMGKNGPLIIDFPQAVDPAVNNNARRLLIRDVNNLARILGRYEPDLRRRRYGEEMWALYERGELTPDTPLTGVYRPSTVQADTEALLAEIAESEREFRERREALGLPPPRPPRAPRFALESVPEEPAPAARSHRKRKRRNKPPAGAGSERRGEPRQRVEPAQPEPRRQAQSPEKAGINQEPQRQAPPNGRSARRSSRRRSGLSRPAQVIKIG